jgi:hypothetical protein
MAGPVDTGTAWPFAASFKPRDAAREREFKRTDFRVRTARRNPIGI